jgi:hypothetical protein
VEIYEAICNQAVETRNSESFICEVTLESLVEIH